ARRPREAAVRGWARGGRSGQGGHPRRRGARGRDRRRARRDRGRRLRPARRGRQRDRGTERERGAVRLRATPRRTRCDRARECYEAVARGKMKKASLGTLFFTVFLDLLGFGLVVPFLPGVARDFGASDSVATLLGA